MALSSVDGGAGASRWASSEPGVPCVLLLRRPFCTWGRAAAPPASSRIASSGRSVPEAPVGASASPARGINSFWLCEKGGMEKRGESTGPSPRDSGRSASGGASSGALPERALSESSAPDAAAGRFMVDDSSIVGGRRVGGGSWRVRVLGRPFSPRGRTAIGRAGQPESGGYMPIIGYMPIMSACEG